MTEKYKRVKIICLETGEIYDSATALAQSLKASKGAVTNHLSGRFPSLRGLHFMRTHEPTPKETTA